MARQHVCIQVPGGIAMGIGTPLADPTHGNFAIVSQVVSAPGSSEFLGSMIRLAVISFSKQASPTKFQSGLGLIAWADKAAVDSVVITRGMSFSKYGYGNLTTLPTPKLATVTACVMNLLSPTLDMSRHFKQICNPNALSFADILWEICIANICIKIQMYNSDIMNK